MTFGAAKLADFTKVIIGTIVQEKNIAFPQSHKPNRNRHATYNAHGVLWILLVVQIFDPKHIHLSFSPIQNLLILMLQPFHLSLMNVYSLVEICIPHVAY